jgi:hypothetical protein
MKRSTFPIARRAALVLALTSAGLFGCEAPTELDSEAPIELSGQNAAFISISGTVRDEVSGRALDNAQLCVRADYESPCAYTDELGRFRLNGVPANSRVSIEMTREYFQSALLPITTRRTTQYWEVSMLSDKAMAMQARRVGTSMDDEQGHLRVRIDEADPTFTETSPAPPVNASGEVRPIDDNTPECNPLACLGTDDSKLVESVQGMAGVQVEVIGSGERAAYADESGLLLKGQRRTTRDGSALVFNMSPGRSLAAVTDQMTSLGCAARVGWIHPMSDAIVRFPVEPGFVTYVSLSCSR